MREIKEMRDIKDMRNRTDIINVRDKSVRDENNKTNGKDN